MRGKVRVLYVTFSHLLVILWWPVLLVEETGENHRHWQALSHNVVSFSSTFSSTTCHEWDLNSQL